MKLLEPLVIGPRQARNRIFFGPHETNLGRGRSISDRHVAYYRRRAHGGAGVIVMEEAAVHPSDWAYERSPLASECVAGWTAVAEACRAEGATVLAALGHSGGQGSSAYSQAAMWAPSRVPEVNSREVPKWMEKGDIAEVVAGFGRAGRLVAEAGLDGVEVNAGQHSLIRQFLSGLTNHRPDEWGSDRLRFAREVLEAVRAGAGSEAVVGLRLSCDELAPWAGITPESATELVGALAGMVDYITVVRGSIYTVSATRPDGHIEPGFNIGLAREMRSALAGAVPVVLQGSVVDVGQAEWALDDGAADAVEMTRAQIADPDLVAKARRGHLRQIRPCILCNQTCQVRDPRNPLVTCVVEPSAGHEWEDSPVADAGTAATPEAHIEVLVVGGGVAGLECARVAALSGHRVTIAERTTGLGGTVRVAARGAGRQHLALLADWLEAECERLGVRVELGRDVGPADIEAALGAVVICTGSLPGRRLYEQATGALVVDAAVLLAGADLPAGPGPVAVWDPIGGPVGISVAELLRDGGREVVLITPDLLAGTLLSRSGDLAPANVRLLASGIRIEKAAELTAAGPGFVRVEDRFSGVSRQLEVVALVDAGPRLPDDALWKATGGRELRAGDAVAPRSAYEAVLEGRRVAQGLTQAQARAPIYERSASI